MNSEINDVAPALIGMQEAAKTLGVSRTMLYDKIRRGATPRRVKFGRLSFFIRREFTDWIAAGCPATWQNDHRDDAQ